MNPQGFNNLEVPHIFLTIIKYSGHCKHSQKTSKQTHK